MDGVNGGSGRGVIKESARVTVGCVIDTAIWCGKRSY
jgi:hypothetical protein